MCWNKILTCVGYVCADKFGTVPNGGGVAMSCGLLRIPGRNESDELLPPMLLAWYDEIGWKAKKYQKMKVKTKLPFGFLCPITG